MNFKQKLIYMALGCLFTLIGYTLATLNTNVTAQSEPTVVDEIVCRKLRIVDHRKMTVALLGDFRNDVLSVYSTAGRKVVGMSRDENGGYVDVNHNSGKSAVNIGIDSVHGFIYVRDTRGVRDRRGTARLQLTHDTMAFFNKGETNVIQAGVDNGGSGRMLMRDQHTKSQMELRFDLHGGYMAISNTGGENVLQAGVNEGGGGTIYTNDKHGYRTGSLP